MEAVTAPPGEREDPTVDDTDLRDPADPTAEQDGQEPQPEPDGPDGDTDPDEGAVAAVEGDLIVNGEGQLSFSVGGKQPTESNIRLLGGKIELPQGQFKKGDRIELIVAAKVTEVHFVDKLDNATGQVVASERRHRAKIVGVELPE